VVTPVPPEALKQRASLWRFSWYRLFFAAILLVPALLCQMIVPIFGYDTWEELSEPVYAQLLRFQRPLSTGDSRVVVLEVDQRTLDAYGWPVDRSYYVQMLLKLQESGHPWLLSLFQFQALDKGKGSAEERADAASKDKALASAIQSYDRFVGSGLKFEAGAELSAEAESELMPRIVLTPDGKPLDELPYLPFNLAESERFVRAQRAFGYGTHFGTEPTIHCMQMYLTDKRHEGSFLIPSSLVWGAAYTTESRLSTHAGPDWPRPREKLSFSPTGRLRIAYKHCLSSPGMLTGEFLSQRGIQRVSLVDLLESSAAFDFKGKIVLLATSDMRRFRGPGKATAGDDGIVPESLLAARFLDDLVEARMIRRDELSRHLITAWLPLALAGGLSLGSLFLSPLGAVMLALGTLGGLLAISIGTLLDGVYLIMTPAMASVAATAAGLGILYSYLRYYGIRRQIRFADKLRERFAQCNSLDEMEHLAQAVCKEEFEFSTLAFADFDRDLYAASADPHRALELLDRQGKESAAAPGQFGSRVDTVQTRVRQVQGIARMPLRSRGMELSLSISSKLGRLGTLKMSLTYKPHEEGFIADLVDILRDEIAQHWHRIKILVDQKLLDYRFLMEQTRGDIMERFLTQVIVAKFSNSKTMMENLRTVLTPRPAKAALMQADIRGYSKVSAQMEPLEMVRLLQRYYSNVVDAAQLVAQVKLIGDCIFLFIEDAAGTSTCSPADMAVELAAILIAETNKQNGLRTAAGEDPLTFGIAINYGDVVVGNLSSDMCIDYTVIGPNVNMVARLEEFTKNPKIGEVLGINGVLVTEDAAQALIRHKDLPFLTIDLEASGLSVRSFPNVKRLKGLTAAMTLSVPADPKQFAQKLAG
jgi:class 3 adenylate cyclase/CHASE2 domain-containing sensor protein